MNALTERIESILFVAARPMNVRRLAEVCGVSKDEVRAAVEELAALHNVSGRGIRIMHLGDEVQMSTSPESSKILRKRTIGHFESGWSLTWVQTVGFQWNIFWIIV